MLPVRTGTLVMLLVALLFGGLAVFLAKIWLSSQQQQIAQQVAPEAPKVVTETVVVAKKELHFGEPLTPEVLSEISWPKEAKPDFFDLRFPYHLNWTQVSSKYAWVVGFRTFVIFHKPCFQMHLVLVFHS